MAVNTQEDKESGSSSTRFDVLSRIRSWREQRKQYRLGKESFRREHEKSLYERENAVKVVLSEFLGQHKEGIPWPKIVTYKEEIRNHSAVGQAEIIRLAHLSTIGDLPLGQMSLRFNNENDMPTELRFYQQSPNPENQMGLYGSFATRKPRIKGNVFYDEELPREMVITQWENWIPSIKFLTGQVKNPNPPVPL